MQITCQFIHFLENFEKIYSSRCLVLKSCIGTESCDAYLRNIKEIRKILIQFSNREFNNTSAPFLVELSLYTYFNKDLAQFPSQYLNNIG
jgi:hypothetical protein